MSPSLRSAEQKECKWAKVRFPTVFVQESFRTIYWGTMLLLELVARDLCILNAFLVLLLIGAQNAMARTARTLQWTGLETELSGLFFLFILFWFLNLYIY